mgnify:CR=1 FL=1
MFFINEDKAYTDGKNIVVDPAFCGIFKDEECLKKTEEFLEWPNLVSVSPWNALKMVSRGLTIHECLHLLYTNFPGNEITDPDFSEFKNGRKVISNISNIIEDAYIEAVGSSVYDNIAIYLMFNRVAPSFAKKEVESTSTEKFKISIPPEVKDFSPSELEKKEEVEIEEKEEEDKTEKKVGNKTDYSPQTGDNTGLLGIGIIALVAVVLLSFSSGKMYRNRR